MLSKISTVTKQEVSGEYSRGKVLEIVDKVDIQAKGTYAVFILLGYLVARVQFISAIAPGGVALLAVMVLRGKRVQARSVGVGVMLGYLSIYTSMTAGLTYLLITVICMATSELRGKLTQEQIVTVVFSSYLGIRVFALLMIPTVDIELSMLAWVVEAMSAACIYFVGSRALDGYRKFVVKERVESEELISGGILIALAISGFIGISIFGISILNLVALSLTIVMAYTLGVSSGVTIGVVLGMIVGVTTPDMTVYIALYAFVAMIAGVFKDGSKWVCSFGCIAVYFVFKLYVQQQMILAGIDIVAAAALFYIIPLTWVEKIKEVIEYADNNEGVSETSIEGFKEIYDEKLNKISNLLYDMSGTLHSIAEDENDTLGMREKSSEIIQNLADRVCENCSTKDVCWGRETHNTYVSFTRLVANLEDKRRELPPELSRNCRNRKAILRNAEDLVNRNMITLMEKKCIKEGNAVLAKQIENFAKTVENIMQEIEIDIVINGELERSISKELESEKVDFATVSCYDNEERHVVKLTKIACGGEHFCVKELLPIIERVTRKTMCVADQGCIVDKVTGECTITFEEAPKYHMETYVAQATKEGEECCGDSYIHSTMNQGDFVNILCDGAGTGPLATQESKMTVNLLEKFMRAGVDKISAIKSVNSLLSLKQDDKFSTVDMCNVNLYTGEADFTKVSAVDSFIRREDNIEVIGGESLPIGMLETIEPYSKKSKIKHGDIVVMVTDGVIDHNDEMLGREEWVKEYLIQSNEIKPENIARGILNEAKKMKNNNITDDMTVVVSKVYNVE